MAATESRTDTEPESAMALALEGEIGQVQDPDYRFELPIPVGWVHRPTPNDEELRVRLVQVATGTKVEVWVRPGEDKEPRPREDCVWTFVDEGHHQTIPSSVTVSVATCTPNDPERPRTFATLLERNGTVLELEVHAPLDNLVQGKREGDEVLAGIRWW